MKKRCVTKRDISHKEMRRKIHINHKINLSSLSAFWNKRLKIFTYLTDSTSVKLLIKKEGIPARRGEGD